VPFFSSNISSSLFSPNISSSLFLVFLPTDPLPP
jgi:hypothetical protein